MPIDINRGSTGITLPAAVSNEILADTVQSSFVMQNVRKTDVPGLGTTIPVILGEPIAGWRGETMKSKASNAQVDIRNLIAYNLSVTEIMSKEFLRDFGKLYDELKRRLPLSLGKMFDATVFGAGAAPGSDFEYSPRARG